MIKYENSTLKIHISYSDSAVSVKYLISRNYYIQINKTWYYLNVYTTIKGYIIKVYTNIDPTVDFVFPVNKIDRENSEKIVS